jgi:hypothetical protein
MLPKVDMLRLHDPVYQYAGGLTMGPAGAQISRGLRLKRLEKGGEP